MAWIESHQELGRHPKTRKLARLLAISVPAAIGHLHLLWWWALDYAQDGDLSKYDPEDIADAVMWDGDAQELCEALIKAGFLDQYESGLRIHDWADYTSKLQEHREKRARNKDLYSNMALTREVRARDGDRCRYCGKLVDWKDHKGDDGGTYDVIDPAGPVTAANVVVACRACANQKAGRTPQDAGMALLPVNTQEKNLPEIHHKSTIDSPEIHLQSTINPPIPNHNLTTHNQTLPDRKDTGSTETGSVIDTCASPKDDARAGTEPQNPEAAQVSGNGDGAADVEEPGGGVEAGMVTVTPGGQPPGDQTGKPGEPPMTPPEDKPRPPFPSKRQERMFDEFWARYPKKKNKGQAERAWLKLKPDETLFAAILSGLERAKASYDWQKDGGQYIPYPATWLNAKGWEDEYTPARPRNQEARIPRAFASLMQLAAEEEARKHDAQRGNPAGGVGSSQFPSASGKGPSAYG